jgi:O-antigen/teichoic acid export membrane protein
MAGLEGGTEGHVGEGSGGHSEGRKNGGCPGYHPVPRLLRSSMTRGPLTSTSLRGRFGSGTVHMIAATFVSAAGAFLFLLIAGRALGPTAFAPITVLWTIQYLAFTTVYMPMEQLTVRRLSQQTPEATPWALYLWVSAACAVGALAFGIFTLDRFFAGDGVYLPILVLMIIGYAGFLLGRGYLAGQRRFKEYAYAVSAESLLRLCLAGVLLLGGAGPVALGGAMVAAPLVVWLWRPFGRRQRSEARVKPEQGATAALGAFVLANAACHTLLAAGPLAVGALGGGAAGVSVTGQTFLLLRAPLAVAINVISRVMPPLTRFVETAQMGRIRRLGFWMGIGGLALGAIGFGLGYLIGPGLVAWLMGSQYRPVVVLAALASAGTALATVAVFAQQILVAMRATGRLAIAWLAGLAAALLVVTLSGMSPYARVAWAFLAGESVSFVLLIGMVLTAPRWMRPAPMIPAA